MSVTLAAAVRDTALPRIRILSSVDFKTNRHNLCVVAVSIGIGTVPLVADKFFAQMPKALSPLLHSGILLASIAAVILNAYFNSIRSAATAKRDATLAAHGAEAH